MSELVFLTEADVERIKLEAIRAFIERVQERVAERCNNTPNWRETAGAWLATADEELDALEKENAGTND